MGATLTTETTSPARSETAFDIANRFRESPPVDLEAMARALGIVVNPAADLPPNISGKITRIANGYGRSRFEIEINRTHSAVRRRFTLAHEIAHFLLHRELMDGGVVDNEMYRSDMPDAVETEANRMAADLLMPANLVKTFWKAGFRSLAQLCNAFGVSEEAMRIRLKQLGYGA